MNQNFISTMNRQSIKSYIFHNFYIYYLHLQKMDTQQSLKSRLYRLQTRNGEDVWIEKCQGYPAFKQEDKIFKLKYYSMPNRQLVYEIIVNSNIDFTRNQSIKFDKSDGIQWIQIRENEIMAINFKEQFSANAFWKLIEEYKRNYAVVVSNNFDTLFYFEYRVPDPSPDNLHQVYQQLQNIPELERHERINSIFLTKRQLLPKLCVVFKILEEKREIEKLEIMFNIVKIIFNSSNEEMLYELMSGDYYMFILGALQYDPNFKSRRPEHRKFMNSQAKLIEVVPFKNPDLLKLIIFTYRLQFVKECVLSPYISDYGEYFSSIIIKNSYEKILAHIFNPKKKEFLNGLFDLLRTQEVNAYKLLRQIFRISKNVKTKDIYIQIAERDFFDIIFMNIIDEKPVENHSNGLSSNKQKKKKTPQELCQINNICIELLENFMENEPMHLKMYCQSEKEQVLHYPAFEKMLEKYTKSSGPIAEKIGKILCELVIRLEGKLKTIAHKKTISSFIQTENSLQFHKWSSILAKIVTNPNSLISENLKQLLQAIFKFLVQGKKNEQIISIGIFKDIISSYLTQQDQIQTILYPFASRTAQFLASNRGNIGIVPSSVLSALTPPRFHGFANKILTQMLQMSKVKPLLNNYIRLLKSIVNRSIVDLPSSLKRQRPLETLVDDQNYQQGPSKKVKKQ